MREGWLLSEGEVVASAVREDAVGRSWLPVRSTGALEVALVIPAAPLCVLRPADELLSILHLSAEGEVTGLHPIKRWCAVRRPRGTTDAVILPSAAVERARLTPGSVLEFRAS